MEVEEVSIHMTCGVHLELRRLNVESREIGNGSMRQRHLARVVHVSRVHLAIAGGM